MTLICFPLERLSRDDVVMMMEKRSRAAAAFDPCDDVQLCGTHHDFHIFCRFFKS